MMKRINETLEPAYEVFRKFEQKLSEQPSEVRLIASIISLIVNVLVPVVYLIAHKPKMAVWMTSFIALQFIIWGGWFFIPGVIGTLSGILVKILSIIWIAFWLHAIYLFFTKIIPEWKTQKAAEEALEEENKKFKGVRLGYKDEELD